MKVERQEGYWWVFRPEAGMEGKWQTIQVVNVGPAVGDTFGLLPGVSGTVTLHDGDSFGWKWGPYLGTVPGDAPLRKLLGRALDLCRSLLRFGPGGAAGAGMLENVNKLSEEAETLR